MNDSKCTQFLARFGLALRRVYSSTESNFQTTGGMWMSTFRSLSSDAISCIINKIASVGVVLKEKWLSALTRFCQSNNVFVNMLSMGNGKYFHVMVSP